jgi:hypothetical protein
MLNPTPRQATAEATLPVEYIRLAASNPTVRDPATTSQTTTGSSTSGTIGIVFTVGPAAFRNTPGTINMRVTPKPAPMVSVVSVAKIASTLVALISVLSLILWLLTGFAAIYPTIAIIALLGAGTFYLMSRVLERSSND